MQNTHKVVLYKCSKDKQKEKGEIFMLAEKIRQVVIEESQKNMFTLKDLQKLYKKVLVFDKLDDLVKHLQDVAQENINNAEKFVKRLPKQKDLEWLLNEDKQTGGVLDVLGKDDVQGHSKYFVAVSDISEPEKHFYLAEDYIWTTDSKQEQIARAVRAEVNESIYRWRRKFAYFVLRKKDIESEVNMIKLEQIHALKYVQREYKKISRFDSESQLIDYLSQKDQQVVVKCDLGYRLTDDFYIEKMDHAIYLAED